MAYTRWRTGQSFGPDEDPDRYELQQLVRAEVGMEGETWRAVRYYRDGSSHEVAVKIKVSTDPDEAIAMVRRWSDSNDRLALFEIRGVVLSTCFSGRLPDAAPSVGRAVYQVSAWHDAKPLDVWARLVRPDPARIIIVLRDLSRIVSELHGHAFVHRDLSGGNILVAADDSVRLIDWTWMNRDGGEVSLPVGTPGYMAPEAGSLPTSDSDRYSVGALCRRLLLPDAGDAGSGTVSASRCRAELVRAGYSNRVAEVVAAMLEREPARRPKSLLPWVQDLEDAFAARDDAGPGYTCLSLLAGSGGEPTIVLTGGRAGIDVHASTADPTIALPPIPSGVRDLVATRGPAGEPVIAVMSGDGTWTLALSDGSTTPLEGGRFEVLLAAEHSPTAPSWIGKNDTAVAAVTLPTGTSAPHPADLGTAQGPLLAAAYDARGRPAALAVHEGRTVCLHGGWRRSVVLAEPADRGALVLNRMGEFEAWLLVGDRVVLVEQLSGEWSPADAEHPDLGLPAESPVTDLAALGHRGGPTVVTCGPSGVWVHEMSARGSRGAQQLFGGSAQRVVLAIGRDWRLRIAAVADGHPLCWQEGYSGEWDQVLLFHAGTG